MVPLRAKDQIYLVIYLVNLQLNFYFYIHSVSLFAHMSQLQQRRSPSHQNQIEIRNKCESFRKSIRKVMVNQKLQSLRKTLIIDPNLSRAPQTQNTTLPISNSNPGPNEKKVSDLLNVLDKFNQKFISNSDYSQIKKFSKKLDAAVIVLGHIQNLITDEKALKCLEQGMTKMSIQKVQIDEENSERFKIINQEEYESLREIVWQPKAQSSKLETLKQIWQMSLLIKLDCFIQSMAELIQSLDYSFEIRCSELIPISVVKWLYFCQQNMNKYMYPLDKSLRNLVNASSINHQHLELNQLYREVCQRLIQFFSIGQINEIFFKPIYQIQFMKDLIHPKITEADLELEEKYIDSSPYQFLIHTCHQSQNMLIKLRDNMLIKNRKSQRFLRIQHIRIENVQIYPFEYLNFLKVHQKELLRSIELSKMLQKHLEQKDDSQKAQQMQPKIQSMQQKVGFENAYFLQGNLENEIDQQIM